ncbi:MAG: TIGR04283 family arsenosugar biosynthesis glycosyltransferase [Caulobacter sp.]
MSSISPERLTVIIPTLNAGQTLAAALASVAGVLEIIVADGGSDDETLAIAGSVGARIVTSAPGRGRQLDLGANDATGDWLLFLHADTALAAGWRRVAADHMGTPASSERAAYFRFSLDDLSWQARVLEAMVAIRCAIFRLPYGDQGLLISRRLFNDMGGFRGLPLMEDVDLVRRLGRRRLAPLSVAARTSADRWRRAGWARRSLRNLSCLMLYFAGVAPARIARLYER